MPAEDFLQPGPQQELLPDTVKQSEAPAVPDYGMVQRSSGERQPEELASAEITTTREEVLAALGDDALNSSGVEEPAAAETPEREEVMSAAEFNKLYDTSSENLRRQIVDYLTKIEQAQQQSEVMLADVLADPTTQQRLTAVKDAAIMALNEYRQLDVPAANQLLQELESAGHAVVARRQRVDDIKQKN